MLLLHYLLWRVTFHIKYWHRAEFQWIYEVPQYDWYDTNHAPGASRKSCTSAGSTWFVYKTNPPVNCQAHHVTVYMHRYIQATESHSVAVWVCLKQAPTFFCMYASAHLRHLTNGTAKGSVVSILFCLFPLQLNMPVHGQQRLNTGKDWQERIDAHALEYRDSVLSNPVLSLPHAWPRQRHLKWDFHVAHAIYEWWWLPICSSVAIKMAGQRRHTCYWSLKEYLSRAKKLIHVLLWLLWHIAAFVSKQEQLSWRVHIVIRDSC